ncbi:MAG: hypothetical protein N2654_04970 [Deltaproteobacteria bacterium]|nr:hypothetical protein [Deltaproteobacteria bacterium]
MLKLSQGNHKTLEKTVAEALEFYSAVKESLERTIRTDHKEYVRLLALKFNYIQFELLIIKTLTNPRTFAESVKHLSENDFKNLVQNLYSLSEVLKKIPCHKRLGYFIKAHAKMIEFISGAIDCLRLIMAVTEHAHTCQDENVAKLLVDNLNKHVEQLSSISEALVTVGNNYRISALARLSRKLGVSGLELIKSHEELGSQINDTTDVTFPRRTVANFAEFEKKVKEVVLLWIKSIPPSWPYHTHLLNKFLELTELKKSPSQNW